jgi:prepilin-type N-terminal cleavage/methylation domain-containing protein
MKKSKGFTLTEVMVAAAIVALMLGAVYTSLLFARGVVQNTHCHMEAEQLAMDQLWNVYNALSFEEITDFYSSSANPTIAEVPSSSMLHNLGGTIRTAVISDTDHFRIIVRVDWNKSGFFRRAGTANETHWIDRYNTLR